MRPNEALYTLQIHHVGGRDGELGEFPLNKNFNNDFLYHIYDPDETCLPQVANICDSRGLNFVLHPFVVDSQSGSLDFFLNYCPCTSSLLTPSKFKPDQYSPLSLLGDYCYSDAFLPTSKIHANAVTLDEIASRGEQYVDFLSMDVQGGEARVLEGATQQISTRVLGVLCEVEFHELYQEQPLFGDIDKFLRNSQFNFMRFFFREAQVNYFRAGIGFRGDGMLMSADALFLRDPDHVEQIAEYPFLSLIKLSFIALSFGYVEYSLDCLHRAFTNHTENKQEARLYPAYYTFMKDVWDMYCDTPYFPQPSFSDLFTRDEALVRFEAHNPHAWETFDRDRALVAYFSQIDCEDFLRNFPALLSPEYSQFENLLCEKGMNNVADLVREKRITHSTMTLTSLGIGKKYGDRYQFYIRQDLERLGLL